MILTILSGWVFSEKGILHHLSIESVKRRWEDWEVQILVLFSLFLQILLILMGNRRKYNPGIWPRLPIWSAYLLADWVATVALGVLFRKQRNSYRYDAHKADPIDDELMAFWAPFLLLHLGGPDTITAYAIADNELWIRHFLGLCVQTGVALYITYTAWLSTRLSILTIPMLLAGVIKYGERTLALRSANREQFLVSLIDPPDPGPNYDKFMDEFSLKKAEGFYVKAEEVIEVSDQSAAGNGGNNSSALLDGGNNSSALLDDAYKFFQSFRRLFVDLTLRFQDRDKSQSYFRKSTCKDAFKLVEIELGFAYDAFYTKAPIMYTKRGCFCRFITSSFTTTVFVFFLFADKHQHLFTNPKKDHHLHADLIITYILLVGALILEFYAVILLLSSDRTKLWLSKLERKFPGYIRSFQPISQIIFCFKPMVYRITSCFQHIFSPVTYFFHQPMFSPIISCFGNIVSKLISSFLLSNKKRWSNSLARYNLLSFSLKRNLVSFLDYKRVQKILKYLPFHETFENHWHKHRCKISVEMKDLIFRHFQKKSEVIVIKKKSEVNKEEKPEVNKEEKAEVDKEEKPEINNEKPKVVKEKANVNKEYDKHIASLCSARGSLVFEEYGSEYSSKFGWTTEVEFDQSILIWHIATDLCYHSDGGDHFPAKDSSNKLSDYMLYLLVMLPFMLPIGIGMIRFRDTCEEANEFSKEKGLSSKDDDKLRTMLLKVSTEVPPEKVKGNRSKSVLFDGCRLAHQLQEIEKKEEKWEFVCNVWIEILGYAASHCRGYYHAQQLAEGGELLAHVWLLMAHLGITITEQFQLDKGYARAKLVKQ